MTFRVLDVETTGVPTELEKHALVEIGYCDVVGPRGQEVVLDPVGHLVNPGRAIPPESSCVHHIRDCDVADAILPEQACGILSGRADVTAYAAHRADFDRQFFGGGDTPWIDTWKAALRLWPASPNHKLQTLRYFLKFDDNPLFERALAEPPHRAAADAYCAAFLLVECLKLTTVDTLLAWTKSPALLVRLDFGMHSGKTWEEVARSPDHYTRNYLHWVIENIHDDRDKRATAKYWLKKLETEKGATTP